MICADQVSKIQTKSELSWILAQTYRGILEKKAVLQMKINLIHKNWQNVLSNRHACIHTSLHAIINPTV